MTDTASHLDLLGIARQVRVAVERDDVDGLHLELSRLRTALMEHVHAERHQLDALPRSAAAIVLEGQRRLLQLVTDVLLALSSGERDDGCACVVRAAEIEVALRQQARLESALLRQYSPSWRAAT